MPLISLIKFSFKRRILINLIFLLSIVMSIVYFIIIPTIDNIKETSQRINEQKLDLETRYLGGQRLKKLNEILKTIEPQINILDKIFISQNRELEFITTLEEVAYRNNITQKINLGEIQNSNNPTYKTMPIQLTAQGKFDDQINYLKDLESLNYYINIDSIKLSRVSARSAKQEEAEPMQAEQNINIAIQGLTFWK